MLSFCIWFSFALHEVVFVHAATLAASSEEIILEDSAAEEFGEAWEDVTKWMMQNGASVLKSVKGVPTQHGGNVIRGVGTDVDIDTHTNFLVVPRRLWISGDQFAELNKVAFKFSDACSQLNGTRAYALKAAIGMALEAKKGQLSYYAPYLKHLPTLEDYKAFYPRLAEQDLLNDFRSLPIVASIREMQKVDAKMKVCFEEWSKQPEVLRAVPQLSQLNWKEVLTALARWRSRCYQIDLEELALIPASDLMNTGINDLLNTDYQFNKTYFVVTTQGHVNTGAELYDSYCRQCDNKGFLSIWGVYLEDNTNMLRHPVDRFCDSLLRDVTQAVLDRSDSHMREFYKNRWKSPRCKQEVLQQPQGPLRCSLARLAWEGCAETWGEDLPKGNFVQIEENMAVSPEEYANYVDESSIRGVHPHLAPQSHAMTRHVQPDAMHAKGPEHVLLRRE